MKIRLFVSVLFFCNTCSGQNSINTLCLDFTLNGEAFSRGKDFRQVFEGVLADISNPPTLVEREKIFSILEKIQEEQNIQKDISGNNISALRAAQVDYLLFGSFSKVLTSETYDFRFEFVRISGATALTKISSPTIRFSEKEMYDSFDFEQKVMSILSKFSFAVGFGIIGSDQYRDIQKQLDEKERKIDGLKAMLVAQNAKEDSINKLKHTIPDFAGRLIVRNDSIIMQIMPLSNVPFRYDFEITNDTGLYILGASITLKWGLFYPEKKREWREIKKYPFSGFTGIDITKPFRLTLRIRNESIYFEEIGDIKLNRELKAVYICDVKNKSLTLIRNKN